MRNAVETSEINRIKDRMLKENPNMSRKRIDEEAERIYYEDIPLKVERKIPDDVHGYRYGINFKVMLRSMLGAFLVFLFFSVLLFVLFIIFK